MTTLGGDRGGQRGRSRIVVNVDDARPQGRGGERTLKRRRARSRHARRRIAILLAIAGLIALALVAAARVWYQSYQRSPGYSLALLVEAAQRSDREEVERLLDVDQVTSSLVPQVVAKVSGAAAMGTPPVPASVRRFVEANAAVLVPGARDAVREALIETVQSGAAAHADSYPFFLTAIGVLWSVDEIKERGDVATVAFKSGGQPVELTLQRAGGGRRWRVIAIKSDPLATRIADNLARRLPALGR